MMGHRRIPDFIVIGSMKCGTTSLHHYLSLHPQVSVSRPKELCFFVGGSSREDNDPPWGNWWRGEDWYRSHFDTRRPACGEVSPAYVGARWGQQTANRMHHMLPDARLILLVREPMARLRSHYLMRRQNADIGMMSFAEYVTDPRHAGDVAYSDYGSQVARILACFPLRSLLVLESADLDHRRAETLARIFAFIGVDPGFRTSAFDRRLFEGRRRCLPSPLGELVLRSPLVRLSERVLPFTVHEQVRNMLIAPFRIAKADLTLPEQIDASLRQRFGAEVALTRRLTRLPLTSLGS
jgi:hypothetical protein